MRKKLLVPPENDNEIIFLPDTRDFLSEVDANMRMGVAHQPYFFNPGVSLKLLFLDTFPLKNKKIIFIDTDRVDIKINIPTKEGSFYRREFINSEKSLYDCPPSSKDEFAAFFTTVEGEIKKNIPKYAEDVLPNISEFKEILLGESGDYLKEILAQSFLKFYGIERNYAFLSNFIKTELFEDFFKKIHKDDQAFREIFNNALDDYKKKYRFRYKNFPFPKLEADELPFWILQEGKRERCFKKDVDTSDIKDLIIFPRASTLTLFLRLYKFDCLVHGIGAANYEWVQNRIIEQFFKQSPPAYVVLSGTFLIGDIKERDLPYFFYSPKRIKTRLEQFYSKSGIMSKTRSGLSEMPGL